MTETDRVLTSIDATLDGYVSWDPDTSADAMRWRPERPGRHARSVYLAPVGALADGPESWTDVGHTADGGFVYGEPNLAERVEAARRFRDQLTVTFRANIDAATVAFASLSSAFSAMGRELSKVLKANHPAVARLQYGEEYRRHRRACRLCNPAGNPKPLTVNGAEYRRRTRARRRRNRR